VVASCLRELPCWPAEHVNCPDAQDYIGLFSTDGAIFESNTAENSYLYGYGGHDNIVIGARRARLNRCC
jgi:hypothetical protein